LARWPSRFLEEQPSPKTITMISSIMIKDHHDKYVRHDEWKKGQHMRQEDWNRAARVDDWRAHHLRRPPNGYEWRDIDGQYVLANSDGVIFQVVVPR
jgi:Ni/Co efflux regulator RcnB